jgi:hypothetical protein
MEGIVWRLAVRSIQVSTDVFAQIWAIRKPGEDSEDAILRRALGCPSTVMMPSTLDPPDQLGIFDAKYGVTFREGFETFRTYLGSEYVAKVSNGRWLLSSDNKTYRSLNELSNAIGAKTENAWANWCFRNAHGERQVVSELRDPDQIAVRRKNREVERASSVMKNISLTTESDGTWRDDVRVSLERIGGKASLHSIYAEVRALRRGTRRSIPTAFEAVVRKTLEENSSDSDAFRGAQDLFRMPEGKGAGIWALR